MVNIRKLNQANIYIKNKDYESAEKIYYELLHDYPESELVLSFWGFFNVKIGKLTKAEKILERAYNKRKTAPTVSALAFTKEKLRKFDDAIILYEEMLKFDNNENIYKSIINCFCELDMQIFIDAYAKKILTVFPDSHTAHYFVINKYIEIGLYKIAEGFCAEAIEKFPDESNIWLAAGVLQEVLYNNEESAKECYLTALDLGNPSAYYHMAVTYTKMGIFDKAEKLYLKALETGILTSATECSIGSLYFTQKKFRQGYEHYLNRINSGSFSLNMPVERVWKSLDTKINEDSNLLVYLDQGLGDCLMFSRYLLELKKRHKNITVSLRPALIKIFNDSFPDINFCLEENIKPENYDDIIIASDLPAYLGLDFDNIPYSDGYLKYDEEKFKIFKEKYFKNDKFKIGFCWKAGSMAMRDHINRTINIDYFKSMFEIFKNNEKIQFYSLQKDDIFDGINKYPEMIDLSSEMENFDDTAALMKNLDLLITVDTSNVHLAGALGIDTVVLLPYCSDWRWFENTETTEWYNSVKIVKQIERQEWFKECDKVIELIKDKLG